MSLRNTINENPIIPVVGVLIALAVCGYFLWGMIMTPKAGEIGGSWAAYYTIDDGKTVFPDKRPPSQPFQKDGKDAVMAFMYTCDNNKTMFCGFLKKMGADPHPRKGMPAQMIGFMKKPGDPDTAWIPDTDLGKTNAIARSVKCPDGSEPIMVTPSGINEANYAKRPGKKQ